VPTPLAHLHIGEKGRTLGKPYEIKGRCYWEHPWGTRWEPDGNLKGTCWEQKNLKKKPPSPFPTQNFKKIKIKAL